MVIKRARPISTATTASAASNAQKVRRGDVRRAVVVRTKYPTRRPDGRYVRFDDNAAVLVNSKKEMIGNRIGGVVAAELRSRGWGKIVSLGECRAGEICVQLRINGSSLQHPRLFKNRPQYHSHPDSNRFGAG